jgi:hypothetical protein
MLIGIEESCDCLRFSRSIPRRSLPPETHPVSDPSSPLPKPAREPIWLEPFPDELLADEHRGANGSLWPFWLLCST